MDNYYLTPIPLTQFWHCLCVTNDNKFLFFSRSYTCDSFGWEIWNLSEQQFTLVEETTKSSNFSSV